MAISQPITNVGGITTEEWYQHTIENTAQGIFTQGIASGVIGNALITPYFTSADLIFRLPEHNHHNKNRLDFGSSRFAISNVGGIHSNAFSTPSINNTAQAINAGDIKSGWTGSPYVSADQLNADLHFRQPENQDTNKTRLDFPQKTGLIITNAGNISGDFGSVDISQQTVFRVAGIDENAIGNTIITQNNANGYHADLIFRLPEYQDYNKNRLDFGDTNALIISGVGNIDANQIPQHTIENTAQGINHSCIYGELCGTPMIYPEQSGAFDDAKQGARVDLQFNRYVFSNAANVPLAFNTPKKISLSGIGACDFGQASIFNKTQFVYPDNALLCENIGFHKLREPFAPNVLVLPSIGDTASIVKTHQIYSLRQQITLGGFDSYQNAITDAIINHDTEPHSIFNRNQFIRAGNNDFSQLGNQHWISNYEREIRLTDKGIKPNDFGLAWIDYGKREINLNNNGIEPLPMYANAHSIGTSQTIAPIGWESTEWLTRIIPERSSIGAIGWDNQEFGRASVFNQTQYIHAKNENHPELTTQWGVAYAYNLWQYIDADLQGIAPLTDTDPHYTQQWHKIANVNRVVGVYGIDSEKHSKQHTIRNKDKRIDAIGFMGSEYGTAFISHRVRYINTQGVSPYTMSRWHAIYNAASGIYPVGFDSLNTGKAHKIENTRRYYRWIGLGEQTEWGTPFIDFAVREVKPYRIAPEYIDKPTVFNSDQYITPDGIESVWGTPTVRETRNIIQIETLQSGEKSVGYPERIYNFNPEIHNTGGFDSSFFGQTLIDNWKKYITPQGENYSLVAKPIYIGDNTQRLYLSGLFTEKHGYPHKVIQGVSPPYATQRIFLNRVLDANGNEFMPSLGIKPPDKQVGIPNIPNHRTIRIGDNNHFTYFGGTTVYSNAIQILSGIYHPFDFGEPFIKHNQTISLHDHAIEPPYEQVSKIRLSPNTIYAPSSDMASGQYKANHPTRNQPNIIGYSGDREIAGYKFGRVEIQNQHRTIYHREPQNAYGNNMCRFGDMRIGNIRNILTVKGFNASRFGLPELPFGEQEIELPRRNTKAYTEFGQAKIGSPYFGVQYIKPQGFVGVIGFDTEIQNFNRELPLTGFDSLKMGSSNPQDKRYMPQSLWIGFPIPTIIEGNEFTEWGNTKIENFHRELPLTGIDSLQMRYDRTKFKDRMKVYRVLPNPPPKKYTP